LSDSYVRNLPSGSWKDFKLCKRKVMHHEHFGNVSTQWKRCIVHSYEGKKERSRQRSSRRSPGGQRYKKIKPDCGGKGAKSSFFFTGGSKKIVGKPKKKEKKKTKKWGGGEINRLGFHITNINQGAGAIWMRREKKKDAA